MDDIATVAATDPRSIESLEETIAHLQSIVDWKRTNAMGAPVTIGKPDHRPLSGGSRPPAPPSPPRAV